MDLKNLLEIAKKAALLAGEKILEVYNSDDFDIEVKGDNSPLTKADKAAHNQIVAILEQTNLPILSEEGADIAFEERKSWEYFWMVDPLDGTKEFIKRNGEFTVNIALIHQGRSILGVVQVPAKNEIYFAIEGDGAFKESNGTVKSIEVNRIHIQNKGLQVVASRSHLNEDTQNFLNTLNEPDIVSMGSSLKLLAVAEGVADLYPRFAPTMEWDTAAAQAVVEAAGGSVTVKNENKNLEYNKENLLNPHFLVAPNSK